MLCLFLVLQFQPILSKNIEIEGQTVSLSQLFVQLRDVYDYQFSYDHLVFQNYSFSSPKSSFSSLENLLDYLSENYPLEYKKMGNVFIIMEKHKEPKLYLLSGQLIDSYSQEVLPYAHLKINNLQTTTDFNGRFSFSTQTDSVFAITASYLGYQITDTLVKASSDLLLKLKPIKYLLDEFVVNASTVSRSSLVGEEPSYIKINSQITGLLPGNPDNAVFNFMRMHPGINASSENYSELTIRGSYPGQSKLYLDGKNIFSLKNFYENIGIVNPMLIQDIQIHKTNYGAQKGNVSGGVVELTSMNGSKNKFNLDFTLDNTLLNTKLEIPIFSKSSLILATRQTYYKLLDEDDVTRVELRDKKEVSVNPNYKFKDFNFKLSGDLSPNQSYYVSAIFADDEFKYGLKDALNPRQKNFNKKETNQQYGLASFYEFRSKNGNQTKWKLNFSSSSNSIFDNQIEIANSTEANKLAEKERKIVELNFYNQISELNTSLQQSLFFSEILKSDIGFEYAHSSIEMTNDSLEDRLSSLNQNLDLFSLFSLNRFQFSKKYSVNLDCRLDYHNYLNKFYFQPRGWFKFDPSKNWSVNFSAGLYSQFVNKSPIEDEYGNYTYFWAISGLNSDIPVVNSQHYSAGVSYKSNGITVCWEPYYIRNDGISFFEARRNLNQVVTGHSLSYGFDLFLKKEFYNHYLMLSYSNAKVEEKFFEKYRSSPLHQRHEFKFSSSFNFKPYYLSLVHIYGSGFPTNFNKRRTGSVDYNSYNRTDIAASYKFTYSGCRFEIGGSIQNLFDISNVKRVDNIRIPDAQTQNIGVQTQALDFSPNFFVKFSF